jgi:pyrimidine-specific ribonucleoside hydrolase
MHASFVNRRGFLAAGAVGAAALAAGGPRVAESAAAFQAAKPPARKVPVIDCTDLYHPHQDVGDNFDIVAAYGLPEVDLRAVVLDATDRYRQALADHPNPDYRDPTGPRDPGFIPVLQLNYLFGRNVPCGVTPFAAMKSAGDTMLDAPRFQQQGVELLLATLRESSEKVDLLLFGSARAAAVAYNRAPDLLRAKLRRIHLCAGASSPDFLEWNVMLDPHAFVCLLRSDLPVAIYPCATKDGPFAYGRHNCFWRMPDLKFIARMDPKLQAYLAFAFTRSTRMDFLRAVEQAPAAAVLNSFMGREHNVWETSVWAQVSGRRIVRRADGAHRLIPAADVLPSDTVLPNELRPCKVKVRDNGMFTFELTDGPTNFLIYDRGDPKENELALRQALPELYTGFRVA